MSQPEKTEPPEESSSVKQAKAATFAQQWFGWIPGSSYLIGSAPSTVTPQVKEEEVEKDDDEEIEPAPTKKPSDLPVKEAVGKPEPEPVRETKPVVESAQQEIERDDEPVAPVRSQEDEEELASRKEQTRKVETLNAKFKGVATKLIAVVGKLKGADFKAWPETEGLNKVVAGFRSSLKKSLSQSHQDIANQNEAIAEKLEEAEAWADEQTKALAELSDRKAKLTEEFEVELKGAEKVAIRGDADDKADVVGVVEVARKKTAKAFAALDFEKVASEIKRLGVALEAISNQIEEKFTDFQKRVESVETGDYARVHKEASDDDKKDLEAALAKAKNSKTLIEAGKNLESLRGEVESVDQTTRKLKQADEAFPGIQKQYESIKSIQAKDLAKPSNAKALTALQKQLENEWGDLQSYREEGQWENFSGSVLDGRFPKLLEAANKLVASDGEAAEAMATAKLEAERLQEEAAAAAKLAAEQLAEANRLRRENQKALGIAEGERRFGNHGNTIIKAVWNKTKPYAPAATNESIKGEYSYTDITAAIGAWGGRVDVGLLTRTYVPGGGNIQDKRTKNANRNEIQANFISEWAGNAINVHVNLRKSDWAVYFPDRDD